MAVTLINSFRAPLTQEGEFLSGWKKTSASLVSKVNSSKPIYTETTGKSGEELLSVNVARWETAEDLVSANPKSVSDADSLPDVQAFPGIFEVVITLP